MKVTEQGLSFLSLSLEALTGSTTVLTKNALLDTGASACAISLAVAQDLRLCIEEIPEHTEVRTAALNQVLRTAGRAQLKLRWKDSLGKRCGTKIWVHVVHDLSQSLLLSHDFIHNHPEVWSVAKKAMLQAEELNVLWFSKRSKEDQKAQQELRAKQLQKNIARAEGEASNGEACGTGSGESESMRESGKPVGTVSGSPSKPHDNTH
jgi:hypothetical protein